MVRALVSQKNRPALASPSPEWDKRGAAPQPPPSRDEHVPFVARAFPQPCGVRRKQTQRANRPAPRAKKIGTEPLREERVAGELAVAQPKVRRDTALGSTGRWPVVRSSLAPNIAQKPCMPFVHCAPNDAPPSVRTHAARRARSRNRPVACAPQTRAPSTRSARWWGIGGCSNKVEH
jgi:hypothetical protein